MVDTGASDISIPYRRALLVTSIAVNRLVTAPTTEIPIITAERPEIVVGARIVAQARINTD
jgi:hypothetical protein